MSRKPIDITGQRFGRLVVVSDSGMRAGDGSVKWRCACDCGSAHLVVASNLRTGSVSSCGCLARSLSSERRRAAKMPPKQCKADDCANDVSKGWLGYCGMHAQRVRRHGSHDAVVDESMRRQNNRSSQLSRVASVKPTTYRKLFGRHEHRVVAEQKIGRPLLPGEHVHHIDGDKHNNRPENLVVMTASDHLRLHAAERRNGSA